jgi:predicted small metal-binding protein
VQLKFRRFLMTKVVYCREVGFDCEGVVRADTEQAVLEMVAEHARTAHGLQTVSPEVVEKVKSVMRDEPAKA